MKIKSEKGFTGVDIAISVVVLFLLVTLVAILTYNINSSAKELEYKTEATDIAINLIEQVKAKGFSAYIGKYDNIVTIDGTDTTEKQPVEGKKEFYQTIKVKDYANDHQTGEDKKELDIVKMVTVTIYYNFKGEQSVDLSVILSKES